MIPVRALSGSMSLLGRHPHLTRLLTSGRWKGMYDAMVKAVEGGEPEKLVPFEEARKAQK